MVEVVDLQPGHHLGDPGGGPEDLDPADDPGRPHPDLLPQGGRAETGAAAHRAVNGPLPVIVLHDDLDARADGRPVRFHPLEFQLDPVVTVTGIREELAAIVVRLDRTSDLGKDILLAVVVDVTKGDGVPLLQLAETTGSRHRSF